MANLQLAVNSNHITDERITELKHIRNYSHHMLCSREIADICCALDELQERRRAELKLKNNEHRMPEIN